MMENMRVFLVDQNGQLVGNMEHNPDDKRKFPRKKKKLLKRRGGYRTRFVGFPVELMQHVQL